MPDHQICLKAFLNFLGRKKAQLRGQKSLNTFLQKLLLKDGTQEVVND